LTRCLGVRRRHCEKMAGIGEDEQGLSRSDFTECRLRRAKCHNIVKPVLRSGRGEAPLPGKRCSGLLGLRPSHLSDSDLLLTALRSPSRVRSWHLAYDQGQLSLHRSTPLLTHGHSVLGAYSSPSTNSWEMPVVSITSSRR
jgi:hypothetical protein